MHPDALTFIAEYWGRLVGALVIFTYIGFELGWRAAKWHSETLFRDFEKENGLAE